MTASRKKASASAGPTAVATNRKARHDYHILEKFEAGIELRGTEVKSVRAGHIDLSRSYGRVENGEVFLHELDIRPYEYGNVFNHEARRIRRLLLHKVEIKKLTGQMALKGQTLIPLRIYFRRGKAKVEIGLCKGKDSKDKRETIRRKTADREAARIIAAHRRR